MKRVSSNELLRGRQHGVNTDPQGGSVTAERIFGKENIEGGRLMNSELT